MGGNATPSPLSAELQQTVTNLQTAATLVPVLAAGVINLQTFITTLQNSPGPISVEDQATLDQAEQLSASLVSQIQAVSTAVPGSTPPSARK